MSIRNIQLLLALAILLCAISGILVLSNNTVDPGHKKLYLASALFGFISGLLAFINVKRKISNKTFGSYVAVLSVFTLFFIKLNNVQSSTMIGMFLIFIVYLLIWLFIDWIIILSSLKQTVNSNPSQE